MPKSATSASTWSRRLLRWQLRRLRSHPGALSVQGQSAPRCERRQRNCRRSRRRDHVEAKVADFGMACDEKKIRHVRLQWLVSPLLPSNSRYQPRRPRGKDNDNMTKAKDRIKRGWAIIPCVYRLNKETKGKNTQQAKKPRGKKGRGTHNTTKRWGSFAWSGLCFIFNSSNCLGRMPKSTAVCRSFLFLFYARYAAINIAYSVRRWWRSLRTASRGAFEMDH